MMITLLDVLLISIGLVLFTTISYLWKIRVMSYLRLMIVVDIMIMTPLVVAIVQLQGFLSTIFLLVVELGGLLYLGIQYSNQVGKPYNQMYAGMVRAKDNKDLNIESSYDMSVSGEMQKLHGKQVEFVDEINTLLREINGHQGNIEGYLDNLKSQSDQMSKEVDTITDDVDQILQNAAVISEKIDEVRTDGIELMDQTGSDINILVEVSNAVDRITDQINIIAVNAAIEAAQTEAETNFGVVADGIQSIANRSRETTDRLTQEIHQLRRKLTTEIKEINNKLTNLEDAILELGELANRSSSFTHQQQVFVDEISSLNNQTRKENNRIKDATSVYKLK